MGRKLQRLIDRAADLGILAELTEVVSEYVEGAEGAAEAYTETHWGEPVEGGALVMLAQPPEAIYSLGELARVEYDTSKGGEFARFYHDFETTKPMLAVDPDGGTLWIVGGDYKVTPRGIVG